MFFRHIRLALLSALLPLHLFGQNVVPEITAPIDDATLFKDAGAMVVPLAEHFNDPDTSGVRLTTVLGNIDVALYDQSTPITVANFKSYVDSGRYFLTDPTTQEQASLFVHRSVPDFVIQSGGFLSTVNPSDPAHVLPTQVTAFAAITNEPGISNTRGTIAMAKLPDDPNSATSQWYINLADNLSLDTDNGGFTVFGRVLGDGMTVADAIADLPRFNFGTPFDTLPLRDYTSGLPTPANLVTIPAISYVSSLTFSAASNHPEIATAEVSGANLLVKGKQLGSATVTVTATDVDGAQISSSFEVTVITNPVHLANISTRAVVGTGDAALIGGFIVRGDLPKRVVIRALGPSLGDANLTGFLTDPFLEVHDGTGAIIASNDNWQEASNFQEVIDAEIAPTKPNESAILLTLPANTNGVIYTAIVRGQGGETGLGLVEIYDLDSGPGSSILNISTRSNVQLGDDVLIGGFIVFGEGSQQVLVRALGPSLADQNVANPLGDPTLTVYDVNGVQVDFNDDWQDNPEADEIMAIGIPPSDPKESAVVPTLVSGVYTAIVRGTGVTPTGNALVEIYALAGP